MLNAVDCFVFTLQIDLALPQACSRYLEPIPRARLTISLRSPFIITAPNSPARLTKYLRVHTRTGQ